MIGTIRSLLLPTIFLLLISCRQWPDLAPVGQVKALPASVPYLIFFGPPSASDENYVTAFVGYYPRLDNPSAVTPVPLFFTQLQPQLEDIFRRLVSLEDHELAAIGLFNPFPRGTELHSVRVENDLAIVDLTRQASRTSDHRQGLAIVAALGHTMMQFPGIKRVIVTANGIPLVNLQEDHTPSPMQVVAPGGARPVVLRQNLSAKRDDADHLMLSFDRPVCLNDVKIFDLNGNIVASRGSANTCKMEFPLYPLARTVILQGHQLQVMWNVVDGLHQLSTGDMVMIVTNQAKKTFDIEH